MSIRCKAFLLVAWALTVAAGASAAQLPLNLGPESSSLIRCPQGTEEIIKVSPSLICLEFDIRNVVVGNGSIPLTVTIISMKDKPLKLVQLSQPDSVKERLIKFDVFEGDEHPPEGGVVKTVYRGRFSIDENVEPGSYPISVRLKYAGKDPPPEDKPFPLKVGGSGAVKFSDSSPKEISCRTAEATPPQHLEIKGIYREYPIRLRRVNVFSNPADLVAAVPMSVDVPIRNRKDVERVDVSFNVREMELKDWVYGFGSDDRLSLEFVYEDDEGRELKSTDSLKLVVRPSVLVLVSAILLGVLAGTVVKTDLKRLQEEGYITKRQKAIFIAGTSVVGLIAALVALIGQVQVSVFKLNGSYDSPKVLFLIGLAATLAGPALLYGMLKSPPGGQGAQNKPRAREE